MKQRRCVYLVKTDYNDSYALLSRKNSIIETDKFLVAFPFKSLPLEVKMALGNLGLEFKFYKNGDLNLWTGAGITINQKSRYKIKAFLQTLIYFVN
jgi:hypothetical protein